MALIGPSLEAAQAKLKAAGADRSPALDARLLLAHVLGVSAHQLPLMADQNLSAADQQAFAGLIARRAKSEPIAYIVGRKGFWEHDFYARPGVLIPRPDTETLVEAVLANLPADQPLHIAELGVGSGAVIASILHERPNWRATATDIDDMPLALARDNAVLADVSDRLNLRKGSWFDALSPEDAPFDAILSNPPYITAAAMKQLMADVRAYEPHVALHGGDDGLDAYRQIISAAPNWLNAGALLAFEIGFDQGSSVPELLQAARVWQPADLVSDLGGHPRVVLTKLVSE